MAYRQHEDSPKVIRWKYSVKLSHIFIVVGLFELIEIKKPKGRDKHQENVRPSGFKRSETKKKLTNYLINYKYYLAIWRSPRNYCIGCHSGFKQSHCNYSRNENKNCSEKEGYACMNKVCPSKTLNIVKVLKDLNWRVCLGRITVDDIEQNLEDRNEKKSDK